RRRRRRSRRREAAAPAQLRAAARPAAPVRRIASPLADALRPAATLPRARRRTGTADTHDRGAASMTRNLKTFEPGYFSLTQPIAFRGTGFEPSASEPLAYRYYDKNRIVAGKRMEEQLRFAACYWHSF